MLFPRGANDDNNPYLFARNVKRTNEKKTTAARGGNTPAVHDDEDRLR